MHLRGEFDVSRPTGPTIARWQMGRQLREMRDAVGLTHAQVAAILGCSDSKIYKIESGDVGVGKGDLMLMLDRYKVPEPMRETMLDLQRQGKERGWWARFGQLPAAYSMYIGLESAAVALRNFELAVVPGLLQTEAYARAIITAQRRGDTPEEVQRRVQVRLARQACLRDDPVLSFWTILDEAVLRRRVGGTAVMVEQLHHLTEVATLPNVIIQVLPFAEGEHPGTLGSLAILEFPETVHSPVAYFETYAGDAYLEREEDLRRVISTYTHMQAAAASEKDSLKLIAAVARELAK